MHTHTHNGRFSSLGKQNSPTSSTPGRGRGRVKGRCGKEKTHHPSAGTVGPNVEVAWANHSRGKLFKGLLCAIAPSHPVCAFVPSLRKMGGAFSMHHFPCSVCIVAGLL